MDRPTTQQFKDLHKALKKHFFKTTIYIPGVDELFNHILYLVEVEYLKQLITLKVDHAVEEVSAELDKQLPDLITPIYQEQESGVSGLADIRLTAPWYTQNTDHE